MSIICFLMGFLLSVPEWSTGPYVQATEEGRLVQFELINYQPDGSKKWEIQGKSADILADIVNLRTIMAKAYGADRNVVLKAQHGKFNKESTNMELRDDVVATTSDGARLTTNKLNWIAKEEKLVTDAEVNIETNDMKTKATGAEGKKSMEQLELKKNVKVDVKTPAMVITCDGPLWIDYPHNIAVFQNNVKVKDAQGELVANRMEVFLEPKTNEITKVVATEHVVIVRGENVSYCEKATYYAKENKIVMEGSPKLEIFPEEKKEGQTQPLKGF